VRLRLLALAAALGLAWAVRVQAAPAQPEFVLIGNGHNPTTGLTRKQAKDFLLGKKKTWTGGKVIVLVLGPPGSPELRWLAGIAGLTDSILMTRIRQQVYEGEMRKPIIAHGEKETTTAVQAEPGALAVLPAAAAASLPEGVRTIPLH